MEDGINQKYKYNPKEFLKVNDYIKGIKIGDKEILSKSITLIESTLPEHRDLANNVLSKITTPKKPSLRIGITGSPGVGKSTFIEAFGCMLSKKEHKIAVLTIDPSSEKSGGSILGDKTRMEQLIKLNNVFIRPTPSKGTLGGVAQHTQEAILLCEAAGYNIIIVETVGVGQSETAIHQMVDFFLLLMLAGAGDELQGIKRGIMELADCIAITKADSGNEIAAKKAKIAYENSLHLFPANLNGWVPKAHTCSSLKKEGIINIWNTISSHRTQILKSDWLSSNRSNQNVFWMHQKIKESIMSEFYDNTMNNKEISTYERLVKDGKMSSYAAAEKILKND